MEGYKKTQARDHQGNILFFETLSEMVRETPERRFVDNIEKTLLNKITANENSLDMLIEKSEALRVLGNNSERIISMLDSYPSDLQDSLSTLERLSLLSPEVERILNNLYTNPIITSLDGNKKYEVTINDSDIKNPKLEFSEIRSELGQPEHYSPGDTWTVGAGAPAVRIDIAPKLIAFDSQRKTVLTYEQGKNLKAVTDAQRENIINSTQVELITAINDNIPQTFISFDVVNQLNKLFGNKKLEETIRSLNLNILTKPAGSSRVAKTQGYLGGNVVQPVRETFQGTDYQNNNFQAITWTDLLDRKFIASWLNSNGEAAVVTYGESNSSITVARPTLSIYIKNPYIGETLVARKDMGDEFNILDWEPVDNTTKGE